MKRISSELRPVQNTPVSMQTKYNHPSTYLCLKEAYNVPKTRKPVSYRKVVFNVIF